MAKNKAKFLFGKEFDGNVDEVSEEGLLPENNARKSNDDLEDLDLPVLNLSGVSDFKGDAINGEKSAVVYNQDKIKYRDIDDPDADENDDALKNAYLDISNEDEPEPLEAPIPESVIKAKEEAKQIAEEKKRAEELASLQEDSSTPPPATYTEDELIEAKKIAMMEGYEKAKNEYEKSNEKQLATVLESLASSMNSIAVANETALNDIKKGSLDLALAVCKKALPAISTRYSFIEVIKTLSDVIDVIKSEERVEIYVSPVLAAKVKDMVDKIKVEKNISCDFVVLSDNNIKINDCKICFENGNIEKNTDDVMAKIDDIIKSYRAAIDGKSG